MNGTVGFIGFLAIENSRQYLLLLTDILHKAVDGFPSSLHRFRLQRGSCLFVCLFVCLFFVAASPLCPVDGVAFALLSDVLSAPRFVVVFFSVAGKCSPARICSQLVSPALLCLLLLLLIALYLQTVTIVSQTLNKQLSVMNKRRQCRASISNPFLISGHEVILDGVNTPWRICC